MVDPTPAATTAARTGRRNRPSMLERCISTDTGSFATQYWGRKPLLSRAASLPRDFSDLLSESMVDELIADRGIRAPFIRMAAHGDLLARECYLGSGGFGAEMPDQVDSAKVLTQFASGATIVLQGLHRTWPPLVQFVRSMVDVLGHPTQANAYITPPSNRGFDPHYDVHDVFVLQVAGHKRWIVHQPVLDHPLPSQPWTDYRTPITARVKTEAIVDTVLSPGDALYLPRGWIHSAEALDTTSIHLTIGVSPTTQLDVLRAVVDSLAMVSDFRKSLPMSVDPTDHGTMAALATKITTEATEVMRHRAADITASAGALLAQRHVDRTRPAPIRPLASLRAAESADTSVVSWRRGLVPSLEHHADTVVLRLADRTITFPTSCRSAVDALAHGLAADAHSLPGLDGADAAVLIRRLLREGVVVPVEQE